jgi:hypothetical protein
MKTNRKAVSEMGAPTVTSAPQGKTSLIRVDRHRVRLTAPAFVFTLDIVDGLRAVSWENRLTGRTLELGGGM